MPHLTAHGWIVAAATILAVGVFVGWGAGRAFQRAVDAYWRFRNHVRMTRTMWLGARSAAGEAVTTVGLAVLVLAAAVVTAWILLK
jgi:hypothetical protein